MIFSNIVRYEENISAEDFINKRIETKDECNQIYLLSTESVLGANCSIPLTHMSNRKIWIEETNERINEFCFAYMLNPKLHKNKTFKDKAKTCLNNTFVADTKKQINKTLMNGDTRVLALLVFNEKGNFYRRKMFMVLSCVIYTIIDRYVCIDYLGTGTKKISELNLGCSLKTKHENKDYDNLFGIGIPDTFMNMLSCQGFLNNNESIVILKFSNRMSEYYFNKGFIQLTCDEGHLKTLPVRVKDRVGAELKVNSDLVMLCYTTITSTSNTLKKLFISIDYHSSYSTDNYNNQTEAMDI